MLVCGGQDFADEFAFSHNLVAHEIAAFFRNQFSPASRSFNNSLITKRCGSRLKFKSLRIMAHFQAEMWNATHQVICIEIQVLETFVVKTKVIYSKHSFMVSLSFQFI